MVYKNLIEKIGFTLKENTVGIFQKKYPNCKNYIIEVDFENELFNYGGLISFESKATQNFSQAENWVVLECVNRLLEKGYQPGNIILEKTWATGHGTSGRLDILVTRDNGTAYLMIECKTYGPEFDKEFKKIQKDGGQLFTYFQQDKNADILLLYTSALDAKGQIQYRNEIIKIESDYRQTGNVKDFYDRWNKLPKNNGVFDSWVMPYNYQSKALTPKNLKDIQQEDSSFIFNQFLEILRHNVVSDKPNAFNKIFTLFLCKIYDEKVTKPNEELAFQWFYAPYQYEGINYGPDDNISFQKRLTDLYKKGMREFLDKEVTDISDADFEKKYGTLKPEVKKQILDEFTEIRLKKNNEFAIKEVFNDDSFEENAKVVKEVVELLQGFKIRYTKKQQYLSDFFELLLTTGLKQESGQFFTPVPVAQFIIKSIPLDKLITEKLNKGERDNLLPTVIDYAAGSGHFITESMHEMQRIIDQANPDDFIPDTAKKIDTWKKDHFEWALKYVYGIEKDYRLVKVGKVGCYLHGDGLAQIVHSDGLANFSKNEEYKGLLRKTDKDFPKENKQFDVVVSNPPYSVSAFKNNARRYYTEDDFDTYKSLTDQSSEIECLFIERTKQLLRDGGIAGIILPSSILSNSGIYTKAREIILQYFDIVAIAELGSNTFMATGTNTVTLFLRRRNNYDCANILASVERAISDRKDITINGIEKPISKYVTHVWEGLSYKDYITIFDGQPTDAATAHEIYKEYEKKINAKSTYELLNKITEREKEKIYYYILTCKQKIVLVKSGEKNEEKQFLGYEFSNRRGSEGIHPVQRGKSIDECTQLFDPEIFDNPEKASTYVYDAFLGNYKRPVHPSLEKNITRLNLVDMLTFDRADFEKSISTAVKKKLKIESKFDQIKLENIATLLKRGKSAKYGKSSVQIIKSGQARGYKEFDFSEKHFVDEKFELDDRQLQKGDILINSSGVGTAGRVTLFDLDGDFVVDSHITILRPDTKKVFPDFILQCLASIGFKNIEAMALGQSGQIELTLSTIENIKIPLPPKDIQKKIVTEISVIEKKEKDSKELVEKLKNKVISVISNNKDKSDNKKLSEICSMKAGKFVSPSDIKPERPNGQYPCYGGNGFRGYTETFTHEGLYPLIGRQGALCGNVCLAEGKFHATEHAVVVTPNPDIVTKWLYYKLVNANLNQYATGTAQPGLSVQNLKTVIINVPLLAEQQKIVSQIEAIEAQIAELEKEIADITHQKELILKKYL